MIIKDNEELQNALITVFKCNMKAYDTIINTLNDPTKNLPASNYKNVCIEKIKGLFMTEALEGREDVQNALTTLIEQTLKNDPLLCLMILQSINLGE